MANIFGTLNPKGATSSGGGGLTIPTITILASQQNTEVLPDINYSLTQEQIDAFNDNNVVEVILPDGTDYLYQANITSDTEQWGIKVFSKVIVGTDATGEYAYSKSLVFITNNITINETTMRSGGGKQLYKHNVCISELSDRFKCQINLSIITDSNTPITSKALLNSALYSQGYRTASSSLQMSGLQLDSNNTNRLYIFVAIYSPASDDAYFNCIGYYQASPSISLLQMAFNGTWGDTVIPL